MRFLSLFLSSLIVLNPLWAQSASDPGLHVHLIDGPGPAKPHTASSKGYVLQVTNAAGAPVAGAAVAVSLPEDGPTGRFANGLRAWVAYSDSAGIAQFPAIKWGDTAGDVELRVTAARGASHSQFMIAQRLLPEAGSVSTVVVAVAPPAPASMPPLDLPALPSSATYKSLADVVPQNPPAAAPAPDPTLPAPAPGALIQPADESTPASVSRSGSSPGDQTRHPLTPNPPPPAKEGEPTVTITNTPTGAGGSESHKKIWLLVGLGGGAAAAALIGFLVAHGGGAGGAGSGSSSGVAIGAPTVTVGHP